MQCNIKTIQCNTVQFSSMVKVDTVFRTFLLNKSFSFLYPVTVLIFSQERVQTNCKEI